MNQTAHKSGWSLVVAGLLAGAFFWLTDPSLAGPGRWMAGENPIDAAQHAWIGTVLGLVGALMTMGIGLWLLARPGMGSGSANGAKDTKP